MRKPGWTSSSEWCSPWLLQSGPWDGLAWPRGATQASMENAITLQETVQVGMGAPERPASFLPSSVTLDPNQVHPFTGSSHRLLQPPVPVQHSLSASLQKSNPLSWTRMTCSKGLSPEAGQKLDIFRMSGMTGAPFVTGFYASYHIIHTACEAGFLNPTLSGRQAMRGKATGLRTHSSQHWCWDFNSLHF